jgi:nucleotide-binding universal stress UspA family protein
VSELPRRSSSVTVDACVHALIGPDRRWTVAANSSLEGNRAIERDGLLFSRVLVSVDGTEPGFEACRQAARLAADEAPIEVVAVVNLADAIWAAYNAPSVTNQLRQEAEEALDEAVRLIGERAHRRFVNGVETAALLHEIERIGATLAAVGWHGHHRFAEIMIGGVEGDLLHSAPCSVLVARPSDAPATFPRSIVVGLDGSPAAEFALEAAEQLATRLRIPLRAVTAVGGRPVDLEQARRRWPSVEEIDARPVEALVAASRSTDLLVVGSRGLHGVRALGSVSERVAHQATCSVLVAR